jgi:hypothetical protein
MSSFIPIGGRKIPCEYKEIMHSELEFYAENPRLYSLLMSEGIKPTQEEIEEALIKKPHVRQLKKEIEQFGGLAEPVYVRDGETKIVLEGNSRLAAYRILNKEDPIKWNKMRCQLLKDISDGEVFALLGMLHIHGKNDWDPYEQAGFFYRRFKNENVTKKELGEQLSMSAMEVGKLIEVYEFMKNKKLPSKQFSHYNVYLRSQKIKTVREKDKGFDDLIIKKIEEGEISEAREVRDNLPKICEKGGNTLKKFIREKLTFEEALEASSGGDYDQQIKKFKDFHSYLLNTKEDILKATGDSKSKCAIILKKIEQCTKEITKKLKKK